jgi:hypothetical protein
MRLRQQMPPRSGRTVKLPGLPAQTRKWITGQLGKEIDLAQLCWLLKVPPAEIPGVRKLYGVLRNEKLLALVPIDYQNEVFKPSVNRFASLS